MIEERVKQVLSDMAEEVAPRPPSDELVHDARRATRRGVLAAVGTALAAVALLVVSVQFLAVGSDGRDPDLARPATSTDRGSGRQPGEQDPPGLVASGEIGYLEVGGSPALRIQQPGGAAAASNPVHLDADNVTGMDWSPNGGRVVVGRSLREGAGEIVVVDVSDGSERVVVSDSGGTNLNPQDPAWSPDGRSFAFSSATGDLYVVPSGGGDPTALTKSGDACSDLFPSWSPDGSRVAFTRDCASGTLMTVDVDSGEVSEVATNRPAYMPDWSPDGRAIAFSDLDQIFVVGVNGSGLRRLTDTPENFEPNWSPDGESIAFVTDRHGNQEVYAINADGSAETRLTETGTDEASPAWRTG